MSEFAGLPQVRMSINEITVLERMVFTHKNFFIKNDRLARENKARIAILARLHLRFRSQITLWRVAATIIPERKSIDRSVDRQPQSDSVVPLTVEEIAALLDAVRFFSAAVTKIIPASPERDAVLQDIEGVRLKLIVMQVVSN